MKHLNLVLLEKTFWRDFGAIISGRDWVMDGSPGGVKYRAPDIYVIWWPVARSVQILTKVLHKHKVSIQIRPWLTDGPNRWQFDLLWMGLDFAFTSFWAILNIWSHFGQRQKTSQSGHFNTISNEWGLDVKQTLFQFPIFNNIEKNKEKSSPNCQCSNLCIGILHWRIKFLLLCRRYDWSTPIPFNLGSVLHTRHRIPSLIYWRYWHKLQSTSWVRSTDGILDLWVNIFWKQS